MSTSISIMSLIELADLTPENIRKIWKLAQAQSNPSPGNVAWSFEGNGIRTRTTFISAFRALGLAYTELPNFLKTTERPEDLAGYLDAFYDIYVIRESNHARLKEFASYSRRPVVNAMSAEGHPCEVLSDAGYIDSVLMPLEKCHICLYGPPTNVFNSWHELARQLGITISHVCPPAFHSESLNVRFTDIPPSNVDIVITDGWPSHHESAISLSLEALACMGKPRLLPTPPFSIGRELAFDPLTYPGFTGYAQKEWLLRVQTAILSFLLGRCARD
ncbi:ornithine carbamoyltransferase [Herbaspirillum huttiense]|uniref:Ornithine carbamoyltransferase n=2 Tax=Herbaspirillum huttiense TaxID=863372 RepID=A0AAJ2HFM6_9BURK|nr:ornithine carbamoyltransferase [Herbaspirillum huttiense]MDR9837810.1 ornithine carbamoyltransferase [Herbaspirillum huttiense]